jgi:hypothetical protein
MKVRLMNLMKKFLFLLFLAILIFPEFQSNFQIIKSKPLKGYFENAAPAEFSDSLWIEGKFQEQAVKHFDDSLGLKSDLVRLYNQIDYTLFRDVHASKVALGKNDCLFPIEYLNAHSGKDFGGATALEARINNLKKLQDFLWTKYKIFLLVVLCPDKPSFYSEYIPDRYRSKANIISNAAYFAKRGAEKGIHVIDFNPYFLAMKSRSHFPLIPKSGVHWSYYGAYLAADSMARYLREKSGYPIPQLILDSISTPDQPIGEDNDMGATLNLIWDLPTQKLGYPKFHARTEAGKPKPAALFVGDSFYWNWFNSGMIKTLFSNSDFWYYCKDVYPRVGNKSLSVSEIDVEDTIKKQNIIVLIQVNGAYGNPGYGFTEIAERELDPKIGRLMKAERMILSHPKWVEDIKKKAKEVHVTFEKQLQEDALWLINFEDKHKK